MPELRNAGDEKRAAIAFGVSLYGWVLCSDPHGESGHLPHARKQALHVSPVIFAARQGRTAPVQGDVFIDAVEISSELTATRLVL